MMSVLSDSEAKTPYGCHLRLCRVRAWLHPIAGKSGQPEEIRKGWSQDALCEMERLVSEFPEEAEVRYWHACCLLRGGCRGEAREVLKEAMRLSGGDHAKTEELLDTLRVVEMQKELGNEAFKIQDWDSAAHHYDAALQADWQRLDVDFSASLFCNRSAAQHKRGRLQAALEDANAALTLTPNYAKALFRRGMLRMDLERYAAALSDFDAVAQVAPGFIGLPEYRKRARCWVQRPPVRNYYALLGVPFDVTDNDLKRAYKAAAFRWHPDKNPSEQRATAERCFKEVQEAFETLSNNDKRREYDGLDRYGEPARQRSKSQRRNSGSGYTRSR